MLIFYKNSMISSSDIFISDKIIDLKNINDCVFQINLLSEIVDKVPIVTNDDYFNLQWKQIKNMKIDNPELTIKSLFKF